MAHFPHPHFPHPHGKLSTSTRHTFYIPWHTFCTPLCLICIHPHGTLSTSTWQTFYIHTANFLHAPWSHLHKIHGECQVGSNEMTKSVSISARNAWLDFISLPHPHCPCTTRCSPCIMCTTYSASSVKLCALGLGSHTSSIHNLAPDWSCRLPPSRRSGSSHPAQQSATSPYTVHLIGVNPPVRVASCMSA
jgi:hypothetical protein